VQLAHWFFWLLTTLVSAGIVFGLDLWHVMPPSDVVGRSADWLQILSLLGIITCATMLCFVFDFNAGQLRKQLQAARKSAEHASRAKSEFLARMSHEIRTLMNGVIGMLELLDHTSVDARQEEYIHLAQQSADSLLVVLNDILDFSKIEAGRLELESIPFALRDVVVDTLQSLEVRAAEKRLELACRIPPDIPDALRGDPGRLRQIIVNLVGNAIKFTECGEVVLSIAIRELTDDRVRLHFSVRDTGIGIPKDKHQRIFEVFGQADSSTTRRFGGTGLGLNISRQLIEMMHGRLGLESEPGQGTEFYFDIELERAVTDSKQTVDPPESLRDVTVLVVDDNSTNRFILTEVLSFWKMNVSSADSGPAAMKILEDSAANRHPIQIAILDMMMPDMDGLMLAEMIHNDSRLRGISLILLSSSSGLESNERCEALGIVSQLRKPVKQAELLGQLTRVRGNLRTERRPRPETPATAARAMRILLAEDNPVNQRVAVGLLKTQGHNVTVANNGRSAVDAFAKEHFDLILMDVEMPEMDGLEATAAIREREKGTGHHTPIVAMTAHAIKGDEERFLKAGMDAHVAKPVEPKKLFQVVEQLTAAFPFEAEQSATGAGT
jgi:two-component system, sensor histidine kinase and response regulator